MNSPRLTEEQFEPLKQGNLGIDELRGLGMLLDSLNLQSLQVLEIGTWKGFQTRNYIRWWAAVTDKMMTIETDIHGSPEYAPTAKDTKVIPSNGYVDGAFIAPNLILVNVNDASLALALKRVDEIVNPGRRAYHLVNAPVVAGFGYHVDRPLVQSVVNDRANEWRRGHHKTQLGNVWYFE